MTLILLALARTVLRGVLPYPDMVRRARVRRRARNLAARDPWPQDEAAATGLDYATLALLRTLWLQRATRRAVRNRDREGAALLARTSMETCILGLWCVHIPEAADRLRAAELKAAPAMLTFVSYTGLIPDALIKEAVDALGQPKQLLTIRSMAEQIDSKTGATLAIHLYDAVYRPASHYFTHASSSALLRHVNHDDRRTIRPANSWIRRAPVRLADACVGLLAGAIAVQKGTSAELFVQYAEGHAARLMPPLLATIGKAMVHKLNVLSVLRMVKQARDVQAHLSRTNPGEAHDKREARVRDLYDTLIAQLGLDEVPAEAIQPIVDHLVAKVLAEWDVEHTSQPPKTLDDAETHEA